VLSPAEIVEHPHLQARGFFRPVPHPARGVVHLQSSPFHVDGSPAGPSRPAPYRVGEDTRSVLANVLGYSATRIEELLAQGAAAAP
jgi:crotonobetainyl-CoA:carnitine CoA-transferase CaiB-like acyl-CoA transferase